MPQTTQKPSDNTSSVAKEVNTIEATQAFKDMEKADKQFAALLVKETAHNIIQRVVDKDNAELAKIKKQFGDKSKAFKDALARDKADLSKEVQAVSEQEVQKILKTPKGLNVLKGVDAAHAALLSKEIQLMDAAQISKPSDRKEIHDLVEADRVAAFKAQISAQNNVVVQEVAHGISQLGVHLGEHQGAATPGNHHSGKAPAARNKNGK